jgi:UDPglucose 6-dehydrogenase
MTRTRLGTVIVMLAVGWAVGSGETLGAEQKERALTRKEVVDLYEGKSWLWEKGVGFFAPKGEFIAFAGDGRDRSNVAGNWEASDDGRLCFAGVWTAKAWRRFARTCFAHKIKDGQIYQRRLPKGEWYVFRHEPQQEGDQKLVAGDHTR